MPRLSKAFYVLEHWFPPGADGSTGGTLYNYKFVEALSESCSIELRALNVPENRTPFGVTCGIFRETRSPIWPWRIGSWRNNLLKEIPRDGRGNLLITTTSTNAIINLARERGYTTVAIVQAYEDFGLAVPDSTIAEKLLALKRLLVSEQGFSPNVVNADLIIVNSDYMLCKVRELLKARPPVAILYPPLTIPINLNQCFSASARTRVGFVNRAGKNLGFVVELARATPQMEFLVFGHSITTAIDLPVNMQVRGWASDREWMYQQAATWIMPSSWPEPFGLVALEALSQGCRVGVSSRGGLPEAVGEYGKIFSGFDVSEWHDWLQSQLPTANQPDESKVEHLSRFTFNNFKRKAIELVSRHGFC